ncbi:MAG: hypothetical protein ACRC5A_16455 [Enterobacteriaceae bacterium]
MAVTPHDFLQSAEKLNDPECEITLRNAVSRAYYSAYHLTLQKVEKASVTLPGHVKGGVHKRLIELFKCRDAGRVCDGLTDIQQKEIAELLDSAKKLRVKADYKLHLHLTVIDRTLALSHANRIRTLLQ